MGEGGDTAPQETSRGVMKEQTLVYHIVGNGIEGKSSQRVYL